MNGSAPSSSPGRIAVWGEVLWDQFPDGPQLGGAPANVAYLAGQLGAQVSLVSRVGDDALGAQARAQLSEFVDVEQVGIDHQLATGEVELSLSPDGEPRYRLMPGRAWERIEYGPRTEQLIDQASCVVWGTLALRSDEGLRAWRNMVYRAHAGDRVRWRICDPNLRPGLTEPQLIAAAIAVANVVKLNDQELDEYAWALDLRDGLRTLRADCEIVCITHGAAGSTVYVGDSMHRLAATPASPGGDNVGCGDAYVAGLAWGLTHGRSPADAAAIGSRLAALVAGHRGATPRLTRANVSAVLGAAGQHAPGV